MSTKKNKEVRINIRLTNNERESFHLLCKSLNSSISEEIRKFINEKINNKNLY